MTRPPGDVALQRSATELLRGTQPSVVDDGHRAFRDLVRRFVTDAVDVRADEINGAGRVPRDVWRTAGALDLLATSFPVEYGGLDLDFGYSIILAEELTRSRARGLNWAMCVHKDMSSNYLLHAAEPVRQRLIPRCIAGDAICAVAMTEPSGGSDLSRIRTRAVRRGDHFSISGQKTFITNGASCDVVIVAARTSDPASRPQDGISLFVVDADTPGLVKGRRLDKTGCPASDTAELFFDDCLVPEEHLIGEENQGFRLLMRNLNIERLIAGAVYVTACEEMLRITRDYCREREVFGAAISEHQANKHLLAHLHTETRLARTFLDACCRRQLAGDVGTGDIAMIKYYASELANRIAYECVGLHGGYGYMQESAIAQWALDVRMFNLGGGTSQIMKEIIAKSLNL